MSLESKNETLCSISANAAACLEHANLKMCEAMLRMQNSRFRNPDFDANRNKDNHNSLVVVRLWQPKQLDNKTCPLPGLAVDDLVRNLQTSKDGSIFLSADTFHIRPNFFNKRLIPTSLLWFHKYPVNMEWLSSWDFKVLCISLLWARNFQAPSIRTTWLVLACLC